MNVNNENKVKYLTFNTREPTKPTHTKINILFLLLYFQYVSAVHNFSTQFLYSSFEDTLKNLYVKKKRFDWSNRNKYIC